MKNFLFLHGGPGTNCWAEEAVFAPHLAGRDWRFHFWQEPSRFRPDGKVYQSSRAYENWLRSATDRLQKLAQENGPIHLVAHSFSVVAATQIAQSDPTNVASLTLLAPTFLLNEGCRNILNLAARDFSDSAPEKTRQIREFLRESQSLFDPSMQAGVRIALEDAHLFSHYFYDSTNLQIYFDAWQKQNAQFDTDSFFDVLRDIAERPEDMLDLNVPVTLPVICFFGKHDPIVHQKLEIAAISRLFKSVTLHVLDKSGHFPHIEQTDLVFRHLQTI